MKRQKLEQLKFILGLQSDCDVMSFNDMQLLKDYIESYDSDENYRYVFLSDGNTEEQLFRYSCSMQQLLIDFKKLKKCERVVHKQVSFEEYQLIKDYHGR